jgi:hypothetical protein
MVRLVVDPHYRHSRMSAARTQDPEALQVSGMIPPSMMRETIEPFPGRAAKKDIDELAFNRRFQRGRDKIYRRDARSVSTERKQQEKRRRSIEELKRREEEDGSRPRSQLSGLASLKRAATVPSIPV